LIQTLKGLELYSNQIGDQGVKHLADALKSNQVNEHVFQTYLIKYFLFLKTLSVLALGNNKIGDEGAKYLAEALQNNTVS
jgi:Ran GTPase-activating protein (RanGAP) involved in mRNA processing and transport